MFITVLTRSATCP